MEKQVAAWNLPGFLSGPPFPSILKSLRIHLGAQEHYGHEQSVSHCRQGPCSFNFWICLTFCDVTVCVVPVQIHIIYEVTEVT